MTKYYYKPITESVFALYLENSGVDKSENYKDGIPAELVVEANNAEEALNIRNLITHSPSWELVREE